MTSWYKNKGFFYMINLTNVAKKKSYFVISFSMSDAQRPTSSKSAAYELREN